jgi:hypothetical protein
MVNVADVAPMGRIVIIPAGLLCIVTEMSVPAAFTGVKLMSFPPTADVSPGTQLPSLLTLPSSAVYTASHPRKG